MDSQGGKGCRGVPHLPSGARGIEGLENPSALQKGIGSEKSDKWHIGKQDAQVALSCTKIILFLKSRWRHVYDKRIRSIIHLFYYIPFHPPFLLFFFFVSSSSFSKHRMLPVKIFLYSSLIYLFFFPLWRDYLFNKVTTRQGSLADLISFTLCSRKLLPNFERDSYTNS